MAPVITASTSSLIQNPGQLASAPKKKNSSKSFKSKSGGLHNINLVLSTRTRKRQAVSNSHIDISNPNLPARDKARLAQLEKTLPKLNGIVPAGVSKAGRGKKKGKKFVEDKESMMEILRLVNETKEVQIEEKLEKGRQLEALREARRKEQEAREEQRQSKLDNAKEAVRRKRKGGNKAKETEENEEEPEVKPKSSKKKRVSFA